MKIFEKQFWHLLAVTILLLLAWLVARQEGFLHGEFWGLSAAQWFYAALWAGVIHQVIVWLVWRSQLHYQFITRLLGRAGFPLYGVIFFIFFFLRFFLIFVLALVTPGGLALPQGWLNLLAVIIALPALYLGYSVVHYFSIPRALGADHFDPAYRTKPLEKRGIFKYTRNGMYIYGLLALWIPGLLWASLPALLVAFFNHLYIWVHYYTVELPDMRHIYGQLQSG